ncbi:phd finger plant-like protein [Anaeramoeba ignava]|uniref:Phd finger plant-like protein n=1 Tax=Anaeramoeba ignava TaxID=1746090 RepID=A0A9Q0LJF4_ANAIG|nr:phd finger plant-like protein [Anaeramoeba ignava]
MSSNHKIKKFKKNKFKIQNQNQNQNQNQIENQNQNKNQIIPQLKFSLNSNLQTQIQLFKYQITSKNLKEKNPKMIQFKQFENSIPKQEKVYLEKINKSIDLILKTNRETYSLQEIFKVTLFLYL